MIFDEAFMQQLASLNMALSLRLHEGMQGGRRSMAKGSSLEFSDFREYGPGDDFRRIDWPAYGRLDKLFVKVFMEEKEAVFNLFLDQSKSMDFGTPTKGRASLQIVAALSYIIMGHMDRVSIRLLGGESETKMARTVPSEGETNEVEETTNKEGNKSGNSQEGRSVKETRITPSVGKQGFHQLLESLNHVRFEGTQDFCSQLMREPIRNKGVSVLVSDFFFEQGLETLEKALAYLRYKKQHIILIQILSKEERIPEDVGDYEFIDSESGKSIRLTLNPKMIEAYKRRLKDYQRELEVLALKYGAKYVSVDAEASIETIILKEFYNKQIIF